MHRIKRLLPLVALYFALATLYFLVLNLTIENSGLVHLLNDISRLEFGMLTSSIHLQSLINPIVAIVLLVGVYRYYAGSRDPFNKLMHFGLFYFGVNYAFSAPSNISWLLDVGHSFGRVEPSFLNYLMSLLNLISFIIVFIVLSNRGRQFQKGPFPDKEKLYGETPYEKYLKEVPRELGLRRLFNYLLDAFFAWILVVNPVISVLGRLEITPPFESYQVTFVICLFLYYLVAEAVSAQTLGKVITGTVVQVQGRSLFGASLLRSLCRLIPFEPFSFLPHIGYGWHDKLSGTYVEMTGAPDRRDAFRDEVPQSQAE